MYEAPATKTIGPVILNKNKAPPVVIIEAHNQFLGRAGEENGLFVLFSGNQFTPLKFAISRH